MERMACGIGELKFVAGDEKTMTFSGYGAVFGNVDAYGDVIVPGAFADTIASARKSGHWPAMLSQHGGWGMGADDLTPVGVWTDLAEDGKGLRVEGKLADTPRGRELYELMKMTPRPAINGLSIGYIPKEWSQRTKPDEPRRTLKKIDLIEISPVTFPANLKARVSGVKAVEAIDEIKTLSDLEGFLREACGFSRSVAVAVIAKAKGCSGQSESGGGEMGELLEAIKRRGEALL